MRVSQSHAVSNKICRSILSGTQATCPLNDTRFFKPMDTPCNRHTALCDRGVRIETFTCPSTRSIRLGVQQECLYTDGQSRMPVDLAERGRTVA